MAKKGLKLSIEENTLSKIKEKVPNLSEFVETIFKEYITLSETNQIEAEKKIKELQNQIDHKNIKLAMYHKMVAESLDNTQEETNLAWRKFMLDYNSADIDYYKETLDLTDEEFANVMLVSSLLTNSNQTDKMQTCTDYSYFREKAKKEGYDL